MMKKILLSICLCFLLTVYVCAEARYDGEYIKEGIINKEELKHNTKEEKECMYKLKKVKKFYINGDFDNAQLYLNEILSIEANNEKANELKNKILLLKEKESFYKKVLVEDYYVELKRAIRDNNFYEWPLYIKKIKSLDSKVSLDSFNNRFIEEKEFVLSTFEKRKDKEIFLKSIDAFLNEKYQKSTRLIYKLYSKYPRFGDFVGISRYYAIKENNIKRVKMLYNKAIKYFSVGTLGQAKTYAEMAYSLEQDNVKLKLLVEHINMEII